MGRVQPAKKILELGKLSEKLKPSGRRTDRYTIVSKSYLHKNRKCKKKPMYDDVCFVRGSPRQIVVPRVAMATTMTTWLLSILRTSRKLWQSNFFTGYIHTTYVRNFNSVPLSFFLFLTTFNEKVLHRMVSLSPLI